MYRLISIVLAMAALAILFFGLSLCNDVASCERVRGTQREGLASRPAQVQRIMVLAGLLAFVGGVAGFLRGPATLPPWADRGRSSGADTDSGSAPIAVRGAAFLGALLALAGILLPVLAFSPPVAPGLGIPFAVTILVAVALVAYFGWHLGPGGGRW
jgi:hypothetical protein